MKNVYLFFFALFCSNAFCQSILVDDTSRSADQLVQLLLGNSCTTVSNISISSSQSTAYFNNNGGLFPVTEGVIIRNGIAKYTEGQYTGNNLSSQINTNTDPTLQNISNSSGQSSPITDVAFLEFDFIPLSTNFSFDFLFASNEFGEFQCGFSDVFAFLLTDLATNTTTNLAIVPGTNEPVSVKNIRDNQYNSSCTSVNPNLFSTYNLTDPSASSINMRGFTQILNAAAVVIPNRSYRIRIVIGDANDSNYDSAVFLSSGSFTTTIDLGPDQTICEGNSYEIKTGLTDPKYIHTWKKNNQILVGETQESLVVNGPGNYQVSIEQVGTNCVIEDEVIFEDLQINTPVDLRNCDSGAAIYMFNLAVNNSTSLGIDASKYDAFYYKTLSDANSNLNPIAFPQNYSTTSEETIYIKIRSKASNEFCNSVLSFKLVLDTPEIPKKPDTIELCDLIGGNQIDLSQNNTTVLDGKDPNMFNISYHSSEADALSNSNPLPSLYSIPPNPKTISIWVRMSNISNQSCFNITSFDIILNPRPVVDLLPNVTACSTYTLARLTNGNYFTGTNGTGVPLFAGDIIDTGGSYYIFSSPDAKSCTNESSFTVTLVDEYTIPEDYCGVFIVPNPTEGNFYTESNGPAGSGTLLPAGTRLTTNQTVYYYAVVEGSICQDQPYNINIIPLPIVDTPTDVVTCTSYALPVLTNGEYYTAVNGNGSNLAAGTLITTSQTLYVYAIDGQCANEASFDITIIPAFANQSSCGSYTLPALSYANYYTQAAGAGTLIPFGTTITNSTTIYVFANTTTTPNCTTNLSFDVVIKPFPKVDQLNDVLRCKNDPYILPRLTNGTYHTGSNRTGNTLNEGDQISTSQTIYINNLVNDCTKESSFKIEIRDIPKLSILTDVTACASYTIPNVSDGLFYSESQGKGTRLNPGQIITQTQTIYLYNQWPDLQTCSNENAITINIIGVTVDKPNNISVCDSYTLPTLNSGDYYTLPGGKGNLLPDGTVISNTQTLYVYAKTGTRIVCEDESEFTVTVSKTPQLVQPNSVTACDYYTLPPLTEGDYFSDTKGGGTKYFTGDRIATNETLYIYATAADNSNCFDEKSFDVIIYPIKDLQLANGIVCVDYITGNVLNTFTANSNLDPSKYTVNWFLSGVLLGTGPSFTTDKEGTYDVIITTNSANTGSDCGYNPTTFRVEKSGPAIATATISDAFTDVIDVTVTALVGYGEYEYKLDDGTFQDDPVFTNVSSGEHLIYINDKKGNCYTTILTITVLKYPKFFTPNNDGYNDYWNITDLATQPNSTVSIFDRYGKLLQRFNTATNGWDGRYNGADLPSDDYWFSVNYILDGKEKIFKSHFTLKR
ncbi:MAG: T9SS type B sorting domain-containing protein [Flavobacteriaceae bacterium]|nr:T9SS type B sorting domain-containing protein [Flavobacteriaceae bacterium]